MLDKIISIVRADPGVFSTITMFILPLSAIAAAFFSNLDMEIARRYRFPVFILATLAIYAVSMIFAVLYWGVPRMAGEQQTQEAIKEAIRQIPQ